MPIITENTLSKYVDDNDIRILRKGDVKPHYGNGLIFPGSKGRDIYFDSEGDGFLDSLIGVGKTILSNIGLIKDGAAAINKTAKAGNKIANLVKKSKEIHTGQSPKEDLSEFHKELEALRKKSGSGFMFTE